MIYIYSKQSNIIDYWEKQFSKEFGISVVERDFYKLGMSFSSDDIFILDLDSFETIEEILSYIENVHKSLNVIALVDSPKLAHGTLMIKKGCKSYIGKKTNKIIVTEVLNTVKDGNVWLYPELMNYIIKNITVTKDKTDNNNLLATLSSKELEVANLVALGNSNKEIATQLDVQLVTIKKHISSIFTKLKLKDRVALAIFINKNKE